MRQLIANSIKLVPGLEPQNQCDHQNTPRIAIEVEEGYFRAQCLTCETVGPVQQSPQAAREELRYKAAVWSRSLTLLHFWEPLRG
jgi:hypothetical protein